jgi:anti-anti-sigma factor
VLEDDPVACSFVSTRGYAGSAVLTLRGELDVSDRAELSSRLAASVSCGPWVIVDLPDLAFMDCSSLAVLVGAREQALLAGGDVLLAGPRRMVVRLLLLTGQDRVFSVFPSVGVAAFSAGLAAIGTRLAAEGVRESPAAANARPLMAAGSPPYPPMAIMTGRDEAGLSGGNTAGSARQRLARALHHSRDLGLRASGDIEPGKTYRAVRREAAAGRYGRIFLAGAGIHSRRDP